MRTNLWEHREACGERVLRRHATAIRNRTGAARRSAARRSSTNRPQASIPKSETAFTTSSSEIGENVVVILSTHIVEDVRQLCQRMAITRRRSRVAAGRARRVVRALRGPGLGQDVAKDEVAAHRASMRVLSAQLHAGKTRIRVLADDAPDGGFEPMTPDLEDVYFLALASGAVRTARRGVMWTSDMHRSSSAATPAAMQWRMLSPMLRFEGRYHVRRLTFLVAVLAMSGTAAMLVGTGYGPDAVNVNSPYTIMQSMGLLVLVLTFVLTIFCANAALRDDEHGMTELVFSRPVGESAYLGVRFAGVLLATALVMLVGRAPSR